MKSLGIDIGSSSIKVVLAAQTSKGVVLESFGEHPYGLHQTHDPSLEVLEILQKIRGSIDPDKTRVVVAVRQEFASVRLKSFPFSDRYKVLKSLPFELEEELPLSAETAIFDVKAAGETTEKNEGERSITEHQFLAVAVPKFRIERLLEVLKSAGIAPDVMSIEGFATFNAFLPQFSKDDTKLNVVLQFGHDHTLMYVHRGRTLCGIRSVLWGAKHIIQALVKKYEIPYIEAMRELKTKGFFLPQRSNASYDQVTFSDIIYQQISDGAKEIKLSLVEVENEFHSIVDNIQVTGGLSNIENIHAALTMVLEKSVNQFSYLSSLTTQFETKSFAESTYATAVGLAFEGLKKPKNPPIQLLRGAFAKDNAYLGNFVTLWGSTLRFSAAVFVLFFAFSIIRDNMTSSLLEKLNDQIAETAKTQAALPAKQANLTGLRNITKDKKRLALSAKSIEKVASMNSPLDLLKKVSDALPPVSRTGKFELTQFRVIDDIVQFSGRVEDKSQVNVFSGILQKLALPNSFKLLSAHLDQNPATFAFEMKLDRGVKR